MTSPRQIAEWDVGALRHRYVDFTETVQAAPLWVRRADAIGAGLFGPSSWDGAGSSAAASDLSAWLAVAARTGAALQTLADDLTGAVSGYGQAQDAAAAALRLAAGSGVPLTGDGWPAPTPAPTTVMSDEQSAELAARAAAAASVEAAADFAMQLAARADGLALSAVEIFARLGISGFTTDSGYAELAQAVHVPIGQPLGPLPVVPVLADPAAVAVWWTSLSLDVQLRLAREEPDQIGGLEGVSAWARDIANRIWLDGAVTGLSRMLSSPGLSEDEVEDIAGQLAMALAVRAALDRAAAEGDQVQLLELDLTEGRAAIAVGDLDTADDIAVLVPGVGVDVTGDISGQVIAAQNLRAATEMTGSDQEVAVLAWIGYDTPNLFQAIFPTSAEAGGMLLTTSLAGLTAAREDDPPQTTVIGHSYGTAVVSEAALEPGLLDADAVVLFGSPGTPADDAADLDVGSDRVFVGDASLDVVPHLSDLGIHVLGPDPSYVEFGAVCVTADMPWFWDDDHHHYYDPESAALQNAALVVVGRYDRVQRRPCDR